MSVSARPAASYAHAPFFLAGAMLVALVAFYPSYLSRLGDTDAIRHFHGIVAFLWMSLLVTQASLAAMRRFSSHRALGKAVYALAPLFVLSGLLIVRDMAQGHNEFQRAFGARLAFVDFLAVGFYAFAVIQALRNRRDMHRHARWMMSTAIVLLPPALARLAPLLPFVQSFDAAFHAGFLATEAVVLWLLVAAARSGRPAGPYRAAFAVTLVQHAGFAWLGGVPAWTAFCAWFGGSA